MIINAELLMLKSEIVTDTAINGGRMNNSEVVTSGELQNVWDSIFEAERLAGSEKYRKTFYKIANDDDDSLHNAKVWIDVRTPGDDWMIFFAGTQTDTQASITGSENCYGCGGLHSNVVATDTIIVVDVEDASLAPGGADCIFNDGDTVRITNKDTPSSGTGSEEFGIINGTPTVANNTEVTITLTTGLLNTYNTDDNTYGTRIMSVYEPGTITGSVDNVVATTAGDGTFDNSGHPILSDHIGTVEQEVTLNFSNATVFTTASDNPNVSMTGDAVSAPGTYDPDNSDMSKNYFVLDYDGFSLTWANGDSLVFQTHPAALAIWQKRVVPVNTDSLAGNRTVFALSGESI